MAKYIVNDNGERTEEAAVSVSAGAADSSKLAELDETGRFDISVMPNAVGADVFTLEADEALAAGDFINIFSDGGTPKARLADASTGLTKTVTGYVLDAFAATTTATVFLNGTNDELSGLQPGTLYYLSETTPGGITATAPSTIGEIIQQVGTSQNSSRIGFQLSNAMLLT